MFFNNSAKRNGLPTDLIKHRLDAKNPKRKPLIDLCKTRWVERVHAFRHFYQAFTFVVEALEVMVYGSGLAVCTFWAPWDAKNKTEALKHLSSVYNGGSGPPPSTLAVYIGPCQP